MRDKIALAIFSVVHDRAMWDNPLFGTYRKDALVQAGAALDEIPVEGQRMTYISELLKSLRKREDAAWGMATMFLENRDAHGVMDAGSELESLRRAITEIEKLRRDIYEEDKSK